MFIIKEGTEPDKIGEGTSSEVEKSIKKYLESKGLTIRSADEDKSYLESQTKEEFDKGYAKAMVETEKAVKEATGEEKASATEKASDYIKRVYKTSEDSQKTISELNAKIEELQEKGVDGNAQAQEYKNQLDTLRKQLKEEKASFEEQIKAKDQSIFDTKLRNIHEVELSKIRGTLDKSIKPELLDDIVENRLSKFLRENKAVQVDDQIVYKGADGDTLISKQDGKPKSSAEVLSELFKDLVDENHKAGGSGSGKGGDGGSGSGSGMNLNVPDSVKSKVQLMEHLTHDLKMDTTSKEFSQAFEEYGKDLPMR